MNILESMSFTHRLFQLCNLTQLQLDKKTWSTVRSRSLEIYTIAIVLLSVGILLMGIFTSWLNETQAADVGDTVDFIQLIGIRFAHTVSITEALLRRSEQQKLIKKIQEIDRIFEMSLNVDIDNQKLRSKTFQYGLEMFALYMGSEICILTASVIGPNEVLVAYWILYLVPLLVCGIRYFQYLLYIAIIKRRFTKLVHLLGDVSLWQPIKDSKRKGPVTIKIPLNLDHMSKPLHVDGIDLTYLLVIRDLYNRLWELTILVNQCFGLSILVNVGNDFLAITSNCYWIFLNFKSYSSTYKDFVRIIGSAVWSIPHVFNMMALAMMCHKTNESTSEIALGVHRIQIDVLNDNHNSLIEQFSLQLLHQKVKFTAFGFFTIDCTLLYTIVGATTTYLIILIQFHMSEQKDDFAMHQVHPAVLNVTS